VTASLSQSQDHLLEILRPRVRGDVGGEREMREVGAGVDFLRSRLVFQPARVVEQLADCNSAFATLILLGEEIGDRLVECHKTIMGV
jgi:hypothetical protein